MLFNLSRYKKIDEKIIGHFDNIIFNSSNVTKLIKNSNIVNEMDLNKILEFPHLALETPNATLLKVTELLLSKLPFSSTYINNKSPLYEVHSAKLELLKKFNDLPIPDSLAGFDFEKNGKFLEEIVKGMVSLFSKYSSLEFINSENFDSIYSFYRIIRHEFKNNDLSYTENPKAYRDKLLCTLIIAVKINYLLNYASSEHSEHIDLFHLDRIMNQCGDSLCKWNSEQSDEIFYLISANDNLWLDEHILHFFMQLSPSFLIDYIVDIPITQKNLIFENKEIILKIHKEDFYNNYEISTYSKGNNNWRKLISKEICNEQFIYEFFEIDPENYEHVLTIIPEHFFKNKQIVFKMFQKIPAADFHLFCSKDLLNNEQFMIELIDRFPNAYDFITSSPLIFDSFNSHRVFSACSYDLRISSIENISLSNIAKIIKNKEFDGSIKSSVLFKIYERSKLDSNFFNEIRYIIKNDQEFATNLLFFLRRNKELLAAYKGLLQKKPSEEEKNSEKNHKRTFNEIDTTVNNNNKKSKH